MLQDDRGVACPIQSYIAAFPSAALRGDASQSASVYGGYLAVREGFQ
jgi:hypothetical protein